MTLNLYDIFRNFSDVSDVSVAVDFHPGISEILRKFNSFRISGNLLPRAFPLKIGKPWERGWISGSFPEKFR